MLRTQPLQITSFTKRYGDKRGVDNISLVLQPGEVFGFLGPNGAGKSTTIRSILNFIEPTEGNISIFGFDSVKDSKVAKNYIGYLSGDVALYDSMTGQQVLTFLSKLGKQTDWDYVLKLVKDLDAELDRPIKTLSKGNKQKIGLIQAFMHKPDLLILDEPTSGLDPLIKQVFYDMVLQMRNEGKTTFVSSHDLSEVQKICDRASFIKDGKIIATEDIKNNKQLNIQRYTATFSTIPDPRTFEHLTAVSDIVQTHNQLMFTVTGSIDLLIKELAKHNITSLTEQETSIEDLFMNYYKKETTNV